MYRDSFSESPWTRILKALSASFRVGRFFRVELRVYWLAILITPLVLLRNAEGLPALQGATYIALTTLILFVIIWTHEMGHIVAGRRYGIETPLITLSPLGGLAHMSSGAPSPGKEVKIALAGPATHTLWLLVFLAPWLLLEPGDLAPEGWYFDPVVHTVGVIMLLNVALLAFNLLPFFPMDGGRALRGLLSKRMHPNRATLIACKVGTIGGIAFIVIGISLWILRDDLWGPILAMIGISNLLACKQEKLAAVHGAGPYMGQSLQPWEQNADAWKQGGADTREDKGPGLLARRRAAREAKQREREAAEAEALQAEVDRILDRVNEVGLDGLTAKEREILMKASKKRK